jgi:uncharacterized membrane protein YhfC
MKTKSDKEITLFLEKNKSLSALFEISDGVYRKNNINDIVAIENGICVARCKIWKCYEIHEQKKPRWLAPRSVTK